MELVVWSQRRKRSHADAVGEEDLRGSVNPRRALFQLRPVNVHVVGKAVDGALQRQGSRQQNEHHKVREESGEPDDLEAVWPDWVVYWTLGSFINPLAAINLPKSPTFLGKFCKGAKIYHFSTEIIFGQLL